MDHAPKPLSLPPAFPQCISCYFRFESENGEGYVVLIIFSPLIQFSFLLLDLDLYIAGTIFTMELGERNANTKN